MKPANNRKRTGQFPKGVSGNPKGRTPGTHNRSTLGIKALIQSIVDFETFDRHYFDYAMSGKPNAVKVAVGKVNAVSAKPWEQKLLPGENDYLVCSPQLWLDGNNAGEGYIRQFVAMPLGMGYTVEAQVTGEEKFGGKRQNLRSI